MTSGRSGVFVRRWFAAAVVVGLSVGTVGPPIRGANAAEAPPQPGANVSRTDRHGDPLPEGALLRLGTVRYRAGLPNDAALSPDGKTLATASQGDITLWDVNTGRPLHRLNNANVPSDFSPGQRFLCFTPDGKRLVSLDGGDSAASAQKGSKKELALHARDVASGTEVRRFDLLGGIKQEHCPAARYVWCSPGGKEIGVVLHGGMVRLLDADTGREIRHWAIGRPLRDETPGVAVSPDGKLLAVIDSTDEKSLLLFNVARGRENRRVRAARRLANVAFGPDSATLAAVDDGSVIRLIDSATGNERKSFAAPVLQKKLFPAGVLSLTFSADGKLLYLASEQGQILRWRMPEAKPLETMEEATLPYPTSWVTGIFPAPDGRSVISVSWFNGLIRRWDPVTGKQVPPPDGFMGTVYSRLSPDGSRVAVGDSAGKLELFDPLTGRPGRLLRAGGPTVTALCWSRDGKTLAVGQGNDAVGIWDAASGREVRVLRLPATGNPFMVRSLDFGPDGRHLLISHLGTRMWDATTGRELWARDSLVFAALSPDGKTAAAWSEFDVVTLLDTATGAVRASHKIETSSAVKFFGSLVFSPDGARLAAALPDGSVHLYDPKTGAECSRFRVPGSAGFQSLALSPDGKWFLTCGVDDVIRLTEVSTGKELLRRTGQAGYSGAEFGPDLHTVISSSLDSTVLVLDLRPRGGPSGAAPAALWADLASDDGAKVYRAIWTLRDDPKSAVALLREKMPPAAAVDQKRVRQLVARLDADAFADREVATRELSALGAPAVPLLKKLQTEPGSPEARRRLRDVVEGLTRRDGADVRHARAVEVLELAATAEARQLLRDWAAGAATVNLAEDARAALARLEHFDGLRGRAGKP
jgi:WD40 repeat protein